MDEIGIDLEAEIARVRGELVSFRDVCLPAFFETMTDEGRRLAGADFGRMTTPSKTIAQGDVLR